MPRHALLTIYKTNILPVFDYGSIIYDNCSDYDNRMSDKAPLSAAKIILGCLKTTSSNDVLADLNLTSLNLRRKISLLCYVPEMITIRFAGWISGRIVSLQPDKDIQKLLSNGNRIRIRISGTLLSILRGFRLLEKVAHCAIIHLLSLEASFQPFAP